MGKSDVLIVIRCHAKGTSRVIAVNLVVRTVNNERTFAKTRLEQAEMTGAGGVVRRLRSRRGPHEYKNARTYPGVCNADLQVGYLLPCIYGYISNIRQIDG
jgi:hypothetical protein